jgi:cyclic-di-AMP phosphodiesterase PgpH
VNFWQRSDAPAAAASRPRALAFHGARFALALALAVATYVFFPASPAVDFPVLEVGSVAQDNVIAPFAFKVRKGDAELARERDEMARSVEPIFVFAPAAVDSSRARLRGLTEGIALVAEAGDAGADRTSGAQRVAAAVAARTLAVQRFAAANGLPLTGPEAAYLVSPARRRSMEEAVGRAIDRWLTRGVTTAGVVDDMRGNVSVRHRDEEREVSADSVLTFNDFVSRARLAHPDPASGVGDAVYVKLLGTVFHASLVYDRAATEARRAQLRRLVDEEKYAVRAGEKIVGAHEVVGREEHEKMRALRDELEVRKGSERALGRIAGAVLFDALVISLFGFTLVLFRPRFYASWRALGLFTVLFLLVLLGAWLVAHASSVHTELIPVAAAAVIIGVLFDPRLAMIAAMVLSILVGGQSAFRGTNALFINLIGGVAAAFSVRVIRRRGDVFRSVIPIAAAYALAALAIGLTLDWTSHEVLVSAGWGAINALASVALAMLLLSPAEEIAGIDTYLKLLEWSDLNRPLMQKLSLEAPGTFDHTIRIANLVEPACNAVGANGLLGRVGAYYHDIGKLKKPQYFVENQPKGRNPHDKLKPVQSAAIIKNHVRDGLELAEEYKLPRAVRAFIPEHHGTMQITYFLEKARERADGTPPNPADFQYPGPTPQSAETAICMLADGVEAAARVIADPTADKIRDVIDHIVRQRIDQGQLRDAPLTLRQLEQVKEQFARVLTGMYHSRIDYPAASGGVTSEFASV